MAEKVCVFGSGLVGILSQDSSALTKTGPLSEAPAVLLWNVGMNHRVGPYRYFVDLARRLTPEGATTLRFDVSGLGDSEMQAGRGSDSERAQFDIREAMQLIKQTCGISKFILVGFCSGVDAAHQIALNDERVVGVVYIEGYAYRSPGFYMNMYRRLINARHWQRYLDRKRDTMRTLVSKIRTRNSPNQSRTNLKREPVFGRAYPTREQFRQDVATLVRRGTKLLFLYVGCGTDYLYQGQFDEMYGSAEVRGKIDIVFFEHADHTFFRIHDRDKSYDVVLSWVRQWFGK